MSTNHSSGLTRRRGFAAVALPAALLAFGACAPESPTTAQVAAEVAASPDGSQAPLTAWHQGFESGVEGWYGAETDGPLGWCGSIGAVEPRGGPRGEPRPSAGRAYAEVRAGPCNGYWSGLGIPGGAPYAPGPDAALYSDGWPAAGYVTELDVYLDPGWSGQAAGALSGFYPNTVLQLAATVMPRDYVIGTAHPAPHWFAPVEAVPGHDALEVLGHRIDEAGWYTFRFLFSDDGGEVRAAFELRGRTGAELLRMDPLAPMALAGPVQVPFAAPLPVDDYGSGHLWFFDAPLDGSTGAPVAVPIDEHRMRPGR